MSDYYGVQGGSGGATTFNQYTMFLEKQGPSSYATGGFVIDLTATYSSINSFKMRVKKGTRGNVPYGEFRYAYNSPSAGKVTVLIEKFQYEKVTALGNVSGQPAGVTVQGTSGVASSSESSHTHDASHNHPSTASSTMTAGGAGTNNNVLQPMIETHTHLVDFPNLSVTTGAGSSHNHTDNTIYAHSHTLTHTATNVSVTELANATNLSATTFLCGVTGVRA